MPALPSHSFTIENEISFSESTPGYPLIHITNHHATATIALHGAHLISYTPRDAKPLIYTSPTTNFAEGKAIRGGIPICWPWFSAHPTNSELPPHGFARNRFWKLIATSSHTDFTELSFELDTRQLPSQLWQHHTTAELTFKIGEKLQLDLLTTNRSSSAITIGGALHTYLEIGDISQTILTGLENTPYLDTTNNTSHTQKEPIRILSETDRIYHPTNTQITIQDHTNNRLIHIAKNGSNSTIIWNPWAEKSKTLADLPDNGYQHFICTETANALTDIQTLSPGQAHTLSTTISSEPINSDHA